MDTHLFLLAAFLYGLIFGSFYNVVIYRLPQMKVGQVNPKVHKRPLSFLSVPRSFCPYCKTPIKFYHNLPLLSYLFLRGRAACCRRRISLVYPAVELSTGLLALFSAYYFGWGMEFFLAFIYLSLLLILSVIDSKKYVLPAVLVAPLLGVGVAASPYFIGFYQSITGVLAGLALMGGIYLAANYIWRRFRNIEAMGDGDVFLMAAVGAWVGSAQIFYVLFLACLLTIAYYLVVFAGPHIYQMLKFKRYKQKGVYFGPFIAAAAGLMFFYGDSIIILMYQVLHGMLKF